MPGKWWTRAAGDEPRDGQHSLGFLPPTGLKYKERSMAEAKKCAHPLCSCMVTDGKYCSQMCEDSMGSESLGCDCPHQGCTGRT